MHEGKKRVLHKKRHYQIDSLYTFEGYKDNKKENKVVMYCHYVPQVYQKNWAIKDSESVYVFDQEKGFRNPERRKICLNFQFIDYYVLPLFSSDGLKYHHLSFFTDFFKSYYNDKFLNFTIKLNLKNIDTEDKFIEEIHNIESFEFFDQNNQQQSTRKIKSELESMWRKEISKIIEDFFSEGVENSWNNILSNTINMLESSNIGFNRYYDDLIEFVAIQLSRDIREPKVRQALNQSLDIVSEILRPIFENAKEFEQILYSEDFAKEAWLDQLLIYIKDNSRDNIIKSIKNRLSSSKMMFLKSKNVGFITTDFPVQLIESNEKGKNILIMPINKQYCLLLVGNDSCDKNQYILLNATNRIAKYINYRLSLGATKIINSNQYYEKDSNKPDKELERMFKEQKILNFF